MFEFKLTPNDNHKSFYGKATVRRDENGVLYLKSYNTTVCSYNPNTGEFKRHWGSYSHTTMRHINAFVAHLCPALHYKDFAHPKCDCHEGGKAWWTSLEVMPL